MRNDELVSMLRCCGIVGREMDPRDVGQIRPVELAIPITKAAPVVIMRLGQILRDYPGERPVTVELVGSPFVVTAGLRVMMTAQCRWELEWLLGPEAVR